ncbi:MAG: hypothetical protein ACM3NT_11335 [Methylocystaceae bacterium]
MKIKSRLRNYGLWVSIASLVGIILKDIGVLSPSDPTWDNIVTAVLSILVTLGILNNPTTFHPWYRDDKEHDPTGKGDAAVS